MQFFGLASCFKLFLKEMGFSNENITAYLVLLTFCYIWASLKFMQIFPQKVRGNQLTFSISLPCESADYWTFGGNFLHWFFWWLITAKLLMFWPLYLCISILAHEQTCPSTTGFDTALKICNFIEKLPRCLNKIWWCIRLYTK